MDIPTQLASGIRALDIRVGMNTGSCSDTLYIFHGSACFSKFVTLREAGAVLKAHPTEFIVMRLGDADEPYGGKTEDELALRTRNTLIAWADDQTYHGTDQNPTVANLRGKIFVLSNFNAAGNALLPGRPYTSIASEDLNSGAVTSVAQILDKWESVQQHLAQASNDSSGTIFLTPTPAPRRAHFRAPLPAATPVADGTQTSTTSCGTRRSGRCSRTGKAVASPGHATSPVAAATMVERRLYQLDVCTHGAGESICLAYYSGLDMMTEAYVAGRDFNGTTSGTKPEDYRRSPQYPGVAKTGIVMSDYPGKNLITAIIAANRGNDSVTAYLDRQPDHNGWYTQPVNVRVRCRGIYYAHCPGGSNDAVIDTLGRDGVR